MDVGIGVIGVGVMGGAHAGLFAGEVKNAVLVAAADRNREAASKAAGNGLIFSSGEDLIAHSSVEAILIASPDQSHFELVSACLEAGKPVLCEKPLAATASEAFELVSLETATGKDLIRVGFMRRFDPAYRALKKTLLDGDLGEPRILHNQHRNAAAPAWFSSDMALTNAAVHEFDISRWLLETEFTRGRIASSPKMGDLSAGDPILLTCETERGTIVSTEVFMNAGYGYDVRCEIVGSLGTASMAQPDLIRRRRDLAERGTFPDNWIPRFREAYRLQDQAWIDGLTHGLQNDVANAWDGFIATFVAEGFIRSLSAEAPVDLKAPARPTHLGS
ncbi:myo-inositol 2-dehydrogenase/D-chiro-inositol 1-dehydrogenase [Aminobacter lissarensis]|uniref:Myo-inositol 2-dehydrogenase/D-chiro-inositol 1-dehydrogenase n=1 Tax=Aminobacter carboxidus TaxID=376165 RepID=A0A8E2BEJ5_9HYPH|nr:Gfo/Idh/MocA family oxidoreductase [Aminobacter lissarensis]MBB6469133.1 myo-inositol 2-dehydrogenase/D-chiro-inositol 1-dehydrogenase [Aminobacter lissarensis]